MIAPPEPFKADFLKTMAHKEICENVVALESGHIYELDKVTGIYRRISLSTLESAILGLLQPLPWKIPA